MSKILPSILLGLAVLLAIRPGYAQGGKAIDVCSEVKQELSQAQTTLDQTKRELDALKIVSTELDAAQQALQKAQADLNQSQGEAGSCQQSRENLCRMTQSFARSLSEGSFVDEGLGECVADPVRQSLVRQLSGWTNVTKVLARLRAYSAGESDLPPRMGPMSGSQAETLLAQSLDSRRGPPLLFRRILVEAVVLLAPKYWKSLKSKPGSVDRWFLEAGELPSELVSEVGGDGREGSRAESAPLAKALDLVSAYEMLADCNGPLAARDCHRATQLRRLIDAHGPLVARRRIEEIWSVDCSELAPTTINDWLRNLSVSRSNTDETERVTSAVRAKLATCFLRDAEAPRSFAAWLAPLAPRTEDIRDASGAQIEELRRTFQSGASRHCGRAVRVLQNLPTTKTCSATEDTLKVLREWSASATDKLGFEDAACDRYARALFAGESVIVDGSFPSPPAIDDVLRKVEDAPLTNMGHLRELCGQRSGQGDSFVAAATGLSAVARNLGEDPAHFPWLIDSTRSVPREDVLAERAATTSHWLRSWFDDSLACSLLELNDSRCEACQESPGQPRYDCIKVGAVEKRWRARTGVLFAALIGLLLLAASLITFVRFRRALHRHGEWHAQSERHLSSLGLEVEGGRLRYFFPERFRRFTIRLPRSSAWARWGNSAIVVRADDDAVRARDINHAGAVGKTSRSTLVFLVHRDGAAPDLGAVRAVLDWSARGGPKAVQIIMISTSRLLWTKKAEDLLELADESSLRSNPFEVRGRVTNSSQFFDRERLVSGLLGSAQAGHFSVITGLRRFGKSSLALEVARRLPGPTAFVDLSGFHHEIGISRDPSFAADAILRFACTQLLASAEDYLGREPTLQAPEGTIDATTLASWLRDFAKELRHVREGTVPPALIIFDEVEQAIGASSELGHALDVLAILMGRLKNALPGASAREPSRVGVIFSSALHPLLWAPLATLAHQSIVGSFQFVAVPCLPREATVSMMQALGARQGIRFSEEALDLIVEESQGVPLLARRLGTSVLELYDPERARQGTLGAVQIGIEGVRAAVEREANKGSPSRVWIESEIAEPKSPGGAVLRALARAEWLKTTEVHQIAAAAFYREFESTGIKERLSPEEGERRAEEAGAVTVRILGESGLLRGHGDLTDPEGYELPGGVIRTILSSLDRRPD